MLSEEKFEGVSEGGSEVARWAILPSHYSPSRVLHQRCAPGVSKVEECAEPKAAGAGDVSGCEIDLTL